ncbi:MAG TPA: retropepsin-like aspartic protease [Acetobacteraceae bacterium]|nr:retropepsin-like aspartic protease [Acetobacteraceae bacterium]
MHATRRLSPAVVALLVFAFPALASAACASPPVVDVPITDSHGKLLVPVGIQGSPEQVALDTGAGVTVISTEAADRLEILHDFDNAAELGGVGGADSVLYIGKVKQFDIGGLHLAKLRMPIVDLPMHTDEGAPVAGFLGADILHAFDVEVDIPGGRLALWRGGACHDPAPDWTDGVTPINFDLDPGNHILVPLRVGESNLTAMLDTGAGTLSLTTRAALRAGLSQDALDADPQIQGTGVNNRAWHGQWHRFDKVDFAGIGFSNVEAGIVPSANISAYDSLGGTDALVGVSLLRRVRLFISYRTRSLYVRPPEDHAGN